MGGPCATGPEGRPSKSCPAPPARGRVALHSFDRDMLDPVLLRAALLGFVGTLTERIRGRDQSARALTLSYGSPSRSTRVA